MYNHLYEQEDNGTSDQLKKFTVRQMGNHSNEQKANR